jgi:hypothetical protein
VTTARSFRGGGVVSGAAADALELLGGGPVGVGGDDALCEVGGRFAEAWGRDEGLHRSLDLLGRSVGWELDARMECLDTTCVKCLIASEWEQELWHAVSKGAQDGSKPTVVDHDSATGHDTIVVGEADRLEAVVRVYRVAIDGGAERQDGVEVKGRDRLADAAGRPRSVPLAASWPALTFSGPA